MSRNQRAWIDAWTRCAGRPGAPPRRAGNSAWSLHPGSAGSLSCWAQMRHPPDSLVDLHELRQGLHGEQEGGIRSTRGLQDLGKIAIAERRELVQHDTEYWPVPAQPMLFAFVPLAYDQLQVLQKHLSQ